MSELLHFRTIILLAMAATLLLLAVRSLRRNRLKERYVLLFMFTGLPFLVLAVWPDGVVFVSEWLSIEKPTVLTLCVAGFFILTTFELLSLVSVQERRITTLAQEVALLKGQQPAKPTPPPAAPTSRSITPI
jgi:hypothetical protein